MLSPEDVVEQARELHEYHTTEREQLNVLRRYLKGRQPLPAVMARDTRLVVKTMARSARVNVVPIVVNSLVQSTFVTGFRGKGEAEDLKVWDAWQANRMDARQTAIHRATATYGTAYSIILPGESPELPVIRGVSPRSLCALYGEDPDWPMSALWHLGGNSWRVIDEEAFYLLERNDRDEWTFIERRPHGMEVTPVVRFVDEDDLDIDDEVEVENGEDETPTLGQVFPLMSIQDQIDLTTFGLHVAQHFGAFKQRYIIGWVADSEKQLLKMSADSIVTIDDENPDKIKVGEWAQTDLDGYIKSREASLRHAATLSQTPVHELIGELVNLSAEALAAAEAGKDRKVDERKTLWGESHEQMLWLCGKAMGVDVPADAQVQWRDTSARAFAATVDALGKLSQMLGVPEQELWERIPDVTKQDIDRWKEAYPASQLQRLQRQVNGAGITP